MLLSVLFVFLTLPIVFKSIACGFSFSEMLLYIVAVSLLIILTWYAVAVVLVFALPLIFWIFNKLAKFCEWYSVLDEIEDKKIDGNALTTIASVCAYTLVYCAGIILPVLSVFNVIPRLY